MRRAGYETKNSPGECTKTKKIALNLTAKNGKNLNTAVPDSGYDFNSLTEMFCAFEWTIVVARRICFVFIHRLNYKFINFNGV